MGKLHKIKKKFNKLGDKDKGNVWYAHGKLPHCNMYRISHGNFVKKLVNKYLDGNKTG